MATLSRIVLFQQDHDSGLISLRSRALQHPRKPPRVPLPKSMPRRRGLRRKSKSPGLYTHSSMLQHRHSVIMAILSWEYQRWMWRRRILYRMTRSMRTYGNCQMFKRRRVMCWIAESVCECLPQILDCRQELGVSQVQVRGS